MDKIFLNTQAQSFVNSIIEEPNTLNDKNEAIHKLVFEVINGKYSSTEDLKKDSEPIDYLLNKMYEILEERTKQKIEKFEQVTNEEIDIKFTIQDALMSLRRFVMDTVALEHRKKEEQYVQKDELTQVLRKASDDLNSIKPSTSKQGFIERIKNIASTFNKSDKANSNKIK